MEISRQFTGTSEALLDHAEIDTGTAIAAADAFLLDSPYTPSKNNSLVTPGKGANRPDDGQRSGLKPRRLVIVDDCAMDDSECVTSDNTGHSVSLNMNSASPCPSSAMLNATDCAAQSSSIAGENPTALASPQAVVPAQGAAMPFAESAVLMASPATPSRTVIVQQKGLEMGALLNGTIAAASPTQTQLSGVMTPVKDCMLGHSSGSCHCSPPRELLCSDLELTPGCTPMRHQNAGGIVDSFLQRLGFSPRLSSLRSPRATADERHISNHEFNDPLQQQPSYGSLVPGHAAVEDTTLLPDSLQAAFVSPASELGKATVTVGDSDADAGSIMGVQGFTNAASTTGGSVLSLQPSETRAAQSAAEGADDSGACVAMNLGYDLTNSQYQTIVPCKADVPRADVGLMNEASMPGSMWARAVGAGREWHGVQEMDEVENGLRWRAKHLDTATGVATLLGAYRTKELAENAYTMFADCLHTSLLDEQQDAAGKRYSTPEGALPTEAQHCNGKPLALAQQSTQGCDTEVHGDRAVWAGSPAVWSTVKPLHTVCNVAESCCRSVH